MMELNLFRYAVAAEETGSFSRAAAYFGIKQSTLSKRIHDIEARLGFSLFERSTRGVTPTAAGHVFLERARRIVVDVDRLTGTTRALANGVAGLLRLGFCGTLAAGDLSAVLASFRCAFPDVEIEPRESGRAGLLDQLENDELDVAVLAGRPSRAGLRTLSFWSEPLTVALSADDPLHDRSSLSWSDLRDREFVVTARDPGPDIAAMIVSRLARPGHLPEIVEHQVSRENLLHLGTQERIPITAGVPHVFPARSTTITFRQIHDLTGPTALDQSVHWRVSNVNPTLGRFLEHLSRRYARPLPDS